MKLLNTQQPRLWILKESGRFHRTYPHTVAKMWLVQNSTTMFNAQWAAEPNLIKRKEKGLWRILVSFTQQELQSWINKPLLICDGKETRAPAWKVWKTGGMFRKTQLDVFLLEYKSDQEYGEALVQRSATEPDVLQEHVLQSETLEQSWNQSSVRWFLIFFMPLSAEPPTPGLSPRSSLHCSSC